MFNLDSTDQVFLGIGIVFLILIVGGTCWALREDNRAEKEIIALGYDGKQVLIFLSATRWDMDDFISSEGVRKAYANFQKTGSMGGITPPDSHNSAVPIAMAAVAISASANAGRH